MNPHFEALAYAAFGLIILYLSGSWIASAINSSRIDSERWAWVPLFGFFFFSTALANLSYLGMPVKYGAPLVVLFSLAAHLIMGKLRADSVVNFGFGKPFAFALGCMLLFLGPYLFTGAFPFLGDEVTYVSIADFVRDNGYFTSTEPAELYPWKSQMLLYQLGQFRMGVQYVLSGFSSLLNHKALELYVPVTAICLFCSYCGIWLLSRAVLSSISAGAARISFVLYSTNLMMVQWPAALNLLPQTGGMALSMGTFAALLAARTEGTKMAVAAGLLLSGVCLTYSEVLPIIVACALVYTVISTVLLRESWAQAVRLWMTMGLVSIAVNPYTAYYSFFGILRQSGSRPGFPMDIPFLNYLRMCFNMVGLVESIPAVVVVASIVAVVLFVFAVAGPLFLKAHERIFVLSSVGIFVGFGLYLSFVSQYSYGVYKILLFSFHLMPLCFGAGLIGLSSKLPAAARKMAFMVLVAAWFPVVGLIEYRYLESAYDTRRHAFYFHPDGPGHFMKYLSDLEGVSQIVRPDQKTLQFVSEDYYNKWVAYFFRKPVGLYYKGDFEGILRERPLPKDTNYDYIILNRRSSSVKDHDLVVYENDLITFSRGQSFVSYGEKGWYEWEMVNGKAMRWMQNSAELIAFAKANDRITITTQAYMGPDRQKKNLIASRGGQVLAKVPITGEKNTVVLRDLELIPGFQTITLATDVESKPAGADPRLLNLMFEAIAIESRPSTLVTKRAEHQQLITGMSSDGWVLKEGIEVTLPVKNAGNYELVISGDVPGLPGLLPQEIIVEGKDLKRIGTGKVSGGGPFSITIPMGQQAIGSLALKLVPTKSVVPKALKINDDPRNLAFHLDSLEMRPAR